MAEYIEREELERMFCRACAVAGEHCNKCVIKQVLERIPSADVADVLHAHWLTWEERFPGRKLIKKNNLGVFCSECHKHADNMTDYCPNCGARMG